ncbi:MAG: diacylglycerol kinase family protein [Thiobacillaceae bacterium]|nr:diacylglycerol kinase family protein [Thiobacillaceae bacterium]MDW8324341.1 diacylglycerol kinase family protein [Burkholderiales bacterium]
MSAAQRRGLAQAFVCAGRGIALAARQRNFRIHLTIAGAVVLAGLGLRITAVEWALVILCFGLVLGLEAANSALEALADRLHPAHDRMIGQAKDLAAGAVLLASLAAAVVGLIVFLPRLLATLP